MVLALDLEALGVQFEGDLGAQVGEVVDRGYGEVTTLVADLVAAVVLLGTGVPGVGLGVDVVEALVRGGREAHAVEHVELGLGAEERGVGDAGGGEVRLGLLRDVARVAAVGLTRDRVVDEEVDVQRLVTAERVQAGRGDVGTQSHVGLVDGLEAADRGAVEGELLRRVERPRRDGEVLHHTRQVAEADVDELDVVLLDVLLHFVGVLEHPTPPTPGPGGGTGCIARGASVRCRTLTRP